MQRNDRCALALPLISKLSSYLYKASIARVDISEGQNSKIDISAFEVCPHNLITSSYCQRNDELTFDKLPTWEFHVQQDIQGYLNTLRQNFSTTDGLLRPIMHYDSPVAQTAIELQRALQEFGANLQAHVYFHPGAPQQLGPKEFIDRAGQLCSTLKAIQEKQNVAIFKKASNTY